MPDKRPNLVLIMTDQQRGDCLGIAGHPALQTPNMDYLAASGTRFRRAYSESPSCIPARRCLISGTAPAANGVVGFQAKEWNPRHTLPGELGKSGYQTHHIGKMHLWPFDTKRFGFDYCEWNKYYQEWLTEVHHQPAYQPSRGHGAGNNSWIGRPHVLPENQMHTFWCADRAIRFINNRDTTVPFFLKLSFTDPHPPLTPPAFHFDRYINRELPKPVVGDWVDTFDGPQKGLQPDGAKICLNDDDMQACRAGYYGMINFIDDQIGRVLSACNSILKDTLFIFTSDHGEMLGDHQLFQKSFPYQQATNIPLIVRPPLDWDVPRGIVSDCPVGLQDIMPTFLDAAGLATPDTCTGRSLMGIVRGEETTVRDVLHGEHAPHRDKKPGSQWLTDGKMTYIWFTQTGREHLFDLENDPEQCHDLATGPDAEARLTPWRQRMMETLDGRPEGFTDGHTLKVGCDHQKVLATYDPDHMQPFL